MVLMNPPQAKELTGAQQLAKLRSLGRVENPGAHSPNTVDCVTCHVATPALKLVVEPGGAAALAAALAGKVSLDGCTAIVLSGGNVDPAAFAEVIAGGP